MGAEVLGACAFDARHGDVEPVQQAPEIAVGQQLVGLGDDGVDVGRVTVPPQRQIDDDLPVGGGRVQVPGDRPGQLRQLDRAACRT